MSLEYRSDRASGLTVTVAEGRITVDDVRRYIEDIVADPTTNDCDELVVLRDVDLKEFSGHDVRDLAQHASKISPEQAFRTAIVAPCDADFGLLRMFEVFRNRPEGKLVVFRDLGSAQAWLGLEKLPDWLDE